MPFNGKSSSSLASICASAAKRDVPMRLLGDDETFADAPELGGLGPLLDQDLGNLERVQKGLHATHKRGVTLANYQEIRIRHYHQVLDRYIRTGQARAATASDDPAERCEARD